MNRHTKRVCRDLLQCIDGLVVERIRDERSPSTETAAAIEHARRELHETIESLVGETIREAVEP